MFAIRYMFGVLVAFALLGCDTVREPELPAGQNAATNGSLSGKADDEKEGFGRWDEVDAESADAMVDTLVSDRFDDAVTEPESDMLPADDSLSAVTPDEALFPDVTGWYRFELTSDVLTRSEGQETLNQTRLFGAARVEAESEAVDFELYLCDIDLPEVQGYQPAVDVAVLQAQPPLWAQGALVDDEGVTTFQTIPAAWTLGADLDDPMSDALPDDPLDPRVIDVDGDGYPGMTLLLGGWSVYGALRMTFELTGVVQDDGLIDGDSALVFDTVILGDNIPFVSVAAQAASAAANTTVVTESHQFSLTPVEATAPSCSDLFGVPGQ